MGRPLRTYFYHGEYLTISELSRLSGISPSTLHSRINAYGYTIEEAISAPLGNRKNRPPTAAEAKKLPKGKKIQVFAQCTQRCNAK